MAPSFDITPEKQAGQLHFLLSQLSESKCPAVTKKDVDLTGKVAIVTGANTGIGLDCARQLLDLGLTKLVLAVRDEAKGQTAAKALSSSPRFDAKTQTIEVRKLDLSSYDSVIEFAERMATEVDPDLIILNAGLFKLYATYNDSTGHDEDVQVNYLSTVLLLVLLLRLVKNKQAANAKSSPPHFVVVTSVVAHWAKFPQRNADPLLSAFDDKKAKWDMQDRYGGSKLLTLLFLSELVKRVPPSVAIINAPTPGLCHGTGLPRDGNGKLIGFIYNIFLRLVGHSSHIGALSLVDAAVKKGQESHGQYIENGKLRPMPTILYTPAGEQVAKRLWKETMNELSFAGIEQIIEAISSE